jgi:hypothetical protein
MSFFAAIGTIFSSATAKIVDSIGAAVDRNLTTDHERLQVEKEVKVILADLEKAVLKANEIEQQELTKRLQADMQSDAWLPKNIRPLTLIFVTVAVTTLSFATIFGDLSDAQVNALKVWVGLWTAVMLTIYGFYFGSRGLEKISTALAGKWNTKR